MDAQTFDRLTTTLAARASRRGLLRGLTALGVGSVLLGPAAAGARRAPGGADGNGATIEATDYVCKGKPAFSNKVCTVSTCGGNCLCGVSVSGARKCVDLDSVNNCPLVNECDRNRDCGPGAVCVQMGACCGTRANLCVPSCG